MFWGMVWMRTRFIFAAAKIIRLLADDDTPPSAHRLPRPMPGFRFPPLPPNTSQTNTYFFSGGFTVRCKL